MAGEDKKKKHGIQHGNQLKETPRRGADKKRNKHDENAPAARRSSSRTRRQTLPPSVWDNDSTPPTRSAINIVDAIPQPPSHLWSSRSTDVTCLSFGLDPGKDSHNKIVCQKCSLFYDVVLKGIMANMDKKLRSKANNKYECDKPWHPDKADDRFDTKKKNMKDFLKFFDINTINISNNTTTVPKSPSPAVTVISVSPSDHSKPMGNESGKKTQPERTSSGIKHNNSNEIILYDQHGVISKNIVQSITQAFKERDTKAWPLQEHELSLLELLLMEGDTVRESAAKMLVEGGTIRKSVATIFEPSLKDKKDGLPLKEHEKRLLGQLAYKAFKHEKKISLPSFPRYPPFEIVQVPKTRAVTVFTEKNKNDYIVSMLQLQKNGWDTYQVTSMMN